MRSERDESELIRDALAGDEGAFAELMRPLYPAAFRLAYELLRDSNEAEDVVQDASFKAWKRLGNVREGAPIRPWFLAIVANRCKSVRRTRWWSFVRLLRRG